MNFVDTASIVVRSGNGGKGHISFRREKFVAKGGPSGGKGGRGGDVVVVADSQLATLLDFKYKKEHSAEDGNPGEASNRTGRSADNCIVRVPTGTILYDAQTEEVLADLDTDGEQVVIAVGGIGGRGNAEFATSTNQAPRYCEPGRPGEEKSLRLELKLVAEVGLVGFPNAGKSTLISVLSDAKPKIADYPFTTLVPNLGVVGVGEEKSFTLADIPGLIEGAHEGRGLGVQFLRHIERTSVHVFLIDCQSDDFERDYKVLCNELEEYSPGLSGKTQIVCISKVDILGDELKSELKKSVGKMKFGGHKARLISSVSRAGLDDLVWEMWNALPKNQKSND